MLRPLIRPIVRPLVRGVTEPGYGSLAAQIRLLFASGEQGAWYDPSDLSTLYQDSAGTTPVTALGQPVGLMLDKSKGLVRGPELVTNGGFDNGITGWSALNDATLTHETGRIKVTPLSGKHYGAALGSATTTVVGRSYELTVDIQGTTNTSVQVGGGITPLATAVRDGTYRAVFVATVTSHPVTLIVNNTSGTPAYFDSISVREIPGNHARQATSTARPAYAAGAKIDHDAVDDKLTTTFPDLGSNVTIVRSVPGTGASILTGQTIGAGARDDNTDHHGLLIINRALTAPETTLVTKWANLRAGV